MIKLLLKLIKAKKIMLSDGTFVEAGLTPEESKERLEISLDEVTYGKTVALVKKITRKIKKNDFSFLLTF